MGSLAAPPEPFAAAAATASIEAPSVLGSLKALAELTKPRITLFILMSAGIGYVCGLGGSSVEWFTVFHLIAGTGLLASGTAALNQWYERRTDALMLRTESRPIPSGRVSAQQALWFGIAIALVGFIELLVGVNALTALLGLFTLVLYLGVYTPLKQRTWHATTLGAIPGAMPPLMGFAAAARMLPLEALVLFAILFVWQFPHFYAIAWMYREDYGRAGIKMLPVVEPDGESTARQILLFSLLLIPVSLIPSVLSMTGNLYLIGTLAMGLVFLFSAIRVSQERTRSRARQVLLASVIYLPVVFGLILLDRA